MPVTNPLERLFVEERRRLEISPNAFSEKAVLKLMFSAMIRAAARWRAIRVTDFKHRREVAVLKAKFDQEYEAQTGLAREPSKESAVSKLSNSSQT